ncbi:MAG: hypothetical protein MJ234_00935, partial [bacterium]|nr:hypothetical protein [bacterium]
ALVLAKEKKYGDAIAEFETAANMNPSDGESLYAIGLICSSSSDESFKNKGMEAFRKCAMTQTQYAALAREKLGESSPVQASEGISLQAPASITAESPEGDISISIPSGWTEVPSQDEGSKYLWIMSNLEKGILFTVYKPFSTPKKGADAAESEISSRTKGLSGTSKSKASINGREFSVAEGTSGAGRTRKIFAAFYGGKVYMFEAEYPKKENSADIDSLMNTAEIK